MATARCPVCEDIISIGIAVKLNQAITCPTCLANLQVVALTPFELEPRKKNQSAVMHGDRKGGRNVPVTIRKSEPLGGIDEDEEFDDYELEKRLHYKGGRERRRDRPRQGG